MTIQDATPFEWTPQRDEAALLVAKDEQTTTDIAASLGVHRVTVERWKSHPDFRARVQGYRSDWRGELTAGVLTERQGRMDIYSDLLSRIQMVIGARAHDMADVPGGKSGLLVRQFKAVGRGETQKVVEEYAFDRALAQELRDLLKQAAQDLGQWTESRDIDWWMKLINPELLNDEQLERLTNGEHPLKVLFGDKLGTAPA